MYLGMVNFKTKDQKFLRTFSIFTSIPLVPKKCGLSISFYEFFSRENERVSNPHIQTISCSYKNFVYFSPYNWLSNWASLLSLSNWILVCGLEWNQKGTNKTLVTMGLGLFYQLLTSPKLPLIIFNTIIYI